MHHSSRDKWLIVSLYLCEGLPFAIVVAMPIVYFKNSGMGNAWLSMWTNIIALPWTLKALWAPIIDRTADKRRMQIVAAQAICAGLCMLLACGNYLHFAPMIMLTIFGMLGFVAATQDLSIDALYLSMFDEAAQARLMWIRNTAFRISYLLGAGILISFAGYISEHDFGGTAGLTGWTTTFILCGIVMALASAYNAFEIRSKGSVRQSVDALLSAASEAGFRKAFKSFFETAGIFRIIAYILVFRLGDAFLSNMAQPFLLDSAAAGGLGLKTSTVGFIYGTCGAISLLIGGVIGGFFITRFGAGKLLIPFSLLQSLSILAYYWLSITKPGVAWVSMVNAIEQLTFGLTTACYSIVLLMAVNKKHLAAHFAFISAVMNIGILMPGMISGSIATTYGYPAFFLLSFLLSALGPCVVWILPKHNILQRPEGLTKQKAVAVIEPC